MSKKVDLVKVLPYSIFKELKKSTDIDFGKDSGIRGVVTTFGHNHMNAATPMDVEEEVSWRNEGHEDKPDEDHGREQHGYQDEEGGPICFMGKRARREDGRPKASRR